MVCGEFEKCGSVHYIKGLDMDVPERRVTLVNNGVLGMNIRGGSEFGLGIYVSRSVQVYLRSSPITNQKTQFNFFKPQCTIQLFFNHKA